MGGLGLFWDTPDFWVPKTGRYPVMQQTRLG